MGLFIKSNKTYQSTTLGGMLKDFKYEDPTTQNLKLFKEYQKNSRINFILGAGSTYDSGLPDWNDLKKKILIDRRVYHIETEKLWKSIQKEFNHKLDNLQCMAIAESVFKLRYPNEKFELLVKEKLYPKEIGENFFFNFIHQIYLLDKIQSVSTYNFDTLLDEYLINNDIFDLEVNHFHGKIALINDNFSKLVFSEGGYIDEYNNESETSKKQIELFSNKLCLFYGLSFSDPNQRRILINTLDITKNKRFAIKKRGQNSNDQKVKNMFFDDYLESLNVKVIYIDKYNEEELKKILF